MKLPKISSHVVYITLIIILIFINRGCYEKKNSVGLSDQAIYESEVLTQSNYHQYEPAISSQSSVMTNEMLESYSALNEEMAVDVPSMILPQPEQYKKLSRGQDTSSVDLEKYFPKSISQGSGEKCVAYTLTYGLYSYFNGRQYKIETKWFDDYTKFDPEEYHSRIKKWGNPPDIPSAIIELFYNGCRSYYDTHQGNSRREQQNTIAGALRIRQSNFQGEGWGPSWLFPNKEARLVKLFRRLLQDGIPIVLNVDTQISGFCNSQDSIWTKDNNESLPAMQVGNHALLLVGYNDTLITKKKGAFKLYNSLELNNEHCKDGYGWLAYDNLNEVIKDVYICYDKPKKDVIVNFLFEATEGNQDISYLNLETNMGLVPDEFTFEKPIDELEPIERLQLEPTTLKVVDPIQEYFLSIKKEYPIGFEKHIPTTEVDSKELIKTMCLTLDLNGQLRIWGRFKQNYVKNPIFVIDGFDDEGRKIATITVQTKSTTNGHFDVKEQVDESLIGILDKIELTKVEYLENPRSFEVEIIEDNFKSSKSKDLWMLRLKEIEYKGFMDAIKKMK